MGWEIHIDIIDSKGKIKNSIAGNVNHCYIEEDIMDVSLPVEGFEDFQTFQFKQSNGKCLDDTQPYKISLKDINYINDPKNWKK